MDKGLSFTYNTTAFPRYHFYQQRLERLVPRWQKILDAGSFPDCKSQGKVKLKQISATAQEVTDKITINVFADSAILKKRKIDLPQQGPLTGNVVVEKLKWTGYLKDIRKKGVTQPTFIVIVAKSVDKIHKDLARLPEPHHKEVIIYNDQTNTCYLYTDLAAREDVDSKSLEHNKSLSKLIHCLLEEKVIIVLELITDYNQEFIPRQEEEVDSSLLDSIHLQLIQSLQDPFVVSDLAPCDAAPERIPSDKELQQVSEVIGTNWQMLGALLGVTNLEMERIKGDRNATVVTQISYMLLTWKKNNGDKATLKELHQAMEQMKIDTSCLNTLFEVGMSDDEKDEVFHKKLSDFIAKKTKCVACDILSKRYGIRASLVNELLNVGFFDYEKQVNDLLKTVSLPKWPRDKSDNGVSTCRLFSYRCSMTMTKTVHEAEDYIKAKLKILTVLKKLQFEIFGQLLQADIPLQVAIPELPKLPLELQYDLLRIEEVTGCGICYGELLIHVKKNLFPAKKAEIKELLSQYQYIGGFKSQLMEEKEKKEQALGLLLEQGQEIRAKKGEDSYSFGSLGCFVRIKPKTDPRGVSQAQAGAMVSSAYEIQEEKDHCLTCAHCLKDCQPVLEVRGGSSMGYSQFGVKKCYLYEPEAIDVASIQVFDDKLKNCDSKLKRSDKIPVENWKTLEIDPIRRDVHKEGHRTGLTRGVVMSTDYMTERMMDYNIQKFQQTGSLEERFNPSFNILIESLPGEGDVIENVMTGERVESFEVHPFSQEGDSGSVIIADEADDTGSVNVVALLLGAVGREGLFLHSYGSLMTRTIEAVEREYNCTVTPSRLPPGGRVLEGAVGGGAVLGAVQLH